MKRLPEVNDGFGKMREQKMQISSLLLLKDMTKLKHKLESGRHLFIEGKSQRK